MQFRKLTKAKLKSLKSKGYNILTSNNKLTDTKVIWFPEYIEDLMDYLVALDCCKVNTITDEPTLLVIDDAINNINEEDLIGEVFV